MSYNTLAHLFITQEHEKTINTDNKTLATDGFGLLRVAVAHTQPPEKANTTRRVSHNTLVHLLITHEKMINTDNKTLATDGFGLLRVTVAHTLPPGINTLRGSGLFLYSSKYHTASTTSCRGGITVEVIYPLGGNRPHKYRQRERAI